jgi:hypothetical protein
MPFGKAIATVLCLIWLIGLGGCGCSRNAAKGPATVPVRGKIVFTRGGDVKTLFNRQGRIELESLDQPGVRAAGPIEEDGGFTVATVVDGAGSAGAVPGKHRVRLDLDDRTEKFVAPQFLSFDKSGITITLPSELPIEIKIWR